MFADDFNREIVLSSQVELLEFIKERPAFNANHFGFTFSENGFPQLTIFVKDDYCVFYFLGEGESYVSLNNNTTEWGVEIFYENEKGTQVELAKECVLNAETMIEVAIQFFVTRSRPICIEWMEL